MFCLIDQLSTDESALTEIFARARHGIDYDDKILFTTRTPILPLPCEFPWNT